MPEALAIAAVFAVAVVAYVSGWLHARNPANYNVAKELIRLSEQHQFLQDRLALAQRERWSPDMINTLSKQLDAISSESGRLRTGGALQSFPGS